MLACLGVLNKVEGNELTERYFSLLGFFSHEYTLIKPQRASFSGSGCVQCCVPMPRGHHCHHTQSPGWPATFSGSAKFGSSARDFRSLLAWTHFRTIKGLTGTQPPLNDHLPVCRGRFSAVSEPCDKPHGIIPLPAVHGPLLLPVFSFIGKIRVGRGACVPSSFVLDQQLCSMCLLFGLLYKKDRYPG